MSLRPVVLAASLFCGLCPGSYARAATLAELFAGGSITADDKRFANWTLVTNATLNGGVVNLNQINVTPLADDPLNPGIQFTAPLGALGTPFGHVGPSRATLTFSFTVETTNQLPLIRDNSLLIDDFIFDAGPAASISIAETIFNLTGGALGEKLAVAHVGEVPGANPNHQDVAVFLAPQSSIRVVKAIDIDGPGTNDGAFLMGFEQRFSQVPEPGFVVLAGVALLCTMARRR
jgi:hypothetical protein